MGIAGETFIFLESCLLGAALGLCYDVLRIFRIGIKCHPLVVAIQDVLYFVLAAITTFSFVLAFNDGKLRMFILVGEIMGGVVYFFTISLLLLKISRLLIKMIKAILRFLYKLLIAPFVWIFKKIFGILYKFGKWIFVKLKNILRNMQIPLKNRARLVYNKRKRICRKKEVAETEKG